MLKNNNQNAVRKIALRSIRHNRMRNLFAILAIILTTLMFTAVFSIGFSLGKNINIMMLREQGTKAFITLEHPTQSQIDQVLQCSHLNAAGIRIPTGIAASEDQASTFVLDYYDTTEFEENFSPAISDLHGSYPDSEQEIMLSQSALQALQIDDPSLQMEITLYIDGAPQTFLLSGWFTDYTYGAAGFQCFVSKAYADHLGLSVSNDGILSISAKLSGNESLMEELDSISLMAGQEWTGDYDVQSESVSTAVIVAVAVGIIGLIIVASGYLLIYNVMYISVSKDIRFYGMLKTIGTSPKQIRKIVRSQTFTLGIIGIPIGVLLGTLISFAAVPYALEVFDSGRGVMPTDISFNPVIYICTILFAILTIAVSCRKPANLASRISPVEALKYQGKNTVSKRQKNNRSLHGGKPYRLAWRNVFREKRRAVLVYASLFMGTIAFLATNAFFGSLKLENYVDYYLPNDYTIYTFCGSLGDEVEEQKAVEQAQRLADELSELRGVTTCDVNYTSVAYLDFDADLYMPFLEDEMGNAEIDVQATIDHYSQTDGEYSAPIIAVSSHMIETYNQHATQKVDIERFERGETCVIGKVGTEEQAAQMQGKTITMHNADNTNELALEVASCMTYDNDRGINIGYYWQLAGAPSCILVSRTALDHLTDTPSIDNIILDCAPQAEPYVTEQVKSLTNASPVVMQVEVKSEMISDFQTSMNGMRILTSGISIILILIGILNFINVMLTSVFTRRKELAVMESVGMTKKQVCRMLMSEGFYYAVVTLLLIGTVGSVIVHFIGMLSEMTANYAVYRYPWAQMLLIATCILLICLIVPAVVYRLITKESVMERMRTEE